jgi:hypothetical protein
MHRSDPTGISGGTTGTDAVGAPTEGASGAPPGGATAVPADGAAADDAAADGETEGGEPEDVGGIAGADGAPQPLGLVVTATGVPGVDESLARLGDADHLTVPGHLEVYEDVHQGLREALSALDQAPGPQPPGAPQEFRS